MVVLIKPVVAEADRLIAAGGPGAQTGVGDAYLDGQLCAGDHRGRRSRVVVARSDLGWQALDDPCCAGALSRQHQVARARDRVLDGERDGGLRAVPRNVRLHRYVRLHREDREQSAERDTQEDSEARHRDVHHLRPALLAVGTRASRKLPVHIGDLRRARSAEQATARLRSGRGRDHAQTVATMKLSGLRADEFTRSKGFGAPT